MTERDIESWRRVSFDIHHYVGGGPLCRAEALLDQAWICAPWLTPQTPDEQCGFCGLCGFGGSNLRIRDAVPLFLLFRGNCNCLRLGEAAWMAGLFPPIQLSA